MPQLFLFGAGHVAQSVYRAARLAGFDVTVIDDREAYANQERYPEAKAIVAADYDEAICQVQVTESSFIVIVTRGRAPGGRDLCERDDRCGRRRAAHVTDKKRNHGGHRYKRRSRSRTIVGSVN